MANSDTISIVDLTEWKRVGSLAAVKEPDGMGYSKLDVKPEGKKSRDVLAGQSVGGRPDDRLPQDAASEVWQAVYPLGYAVS